MKWDRRAVLAATIGAGLALAFLQNSAIVELDQEFFALKLGADPRLYGGDPLLRATVSGGLYTLAPELLGRLMSVFHIGAVVPFAAVLQAALWATQILFFFLFAEKLSGRLWTPALATLLYCWNTPIFKLADSPISPCMSLGRSMGMAVVLPSLYFYFSGRKWLGWLLMAAALYVHGNPALFMLMLYGMEDAVQALSRREPAKACLLRLAVVAALISPMALRELGGKPLPADLLPFVYTMLWGSVSSVIHAVVWADWILFFQGFAFVLLAWPALRTLPKAGPVSRMFVFSLCLLFLSVAGRVIVYPLCRPLGMFLIKITGLGLLNLAELLGLIVVCHGLLLAAQEKRDWLFPTLIALYALMTSGQQHDYVLRTFALLVLACRFLGGVGRRLAGAAAWGTASCSLVWLWQGGRLAELWRRCLHLGGGVFSLPAFQWMTPVAIIAALSLALSVRRRRWQQYSAPAAILFCCCAAALLHRGLPAERVLALDPAWEGTVDWVRTRTPADSFILLPYGGPFGFYEFMAEADRAAFTPYYINATMLYQYGTRALPMARRLDDVGYNLAACADFQKLGQETERVFRSIDLARVRALAGKYRLDYFIAQEPFNPARALEPVYQNGPYRIYKLQT